MAKNLGMTHGLIVAEAVMMGLAPHTGRNEAHDLVYDACRLAIETDRALVDVLLETPAVAAPLGPDKLRALTDPANYLGAAPIMTDHLGSRKVVAKSPSDLNPRSSCPCLSRVSTSYGTGAGSVDGRNKSGHDNLWLYCRCVRIAFSTLRSCTGQPWACLGHPRLPSARPLERFSTE